MSQARCRLLEVAQEAGYGEADNRAIIRAFGALQDGSPGVEHRPDVA